MVFALLGFVFISAAADVGSAALIFSAIGGLTGLAAIGGLLVNTYLGRRKAKVDDKSVAITELEKAVPGLGGIISYWQGVVEQLQTDYAACKADNLSLRKEVEDCHNRITELERGGELK